ncbi:MAG: sugar ABC transporter permease [Clostridia bacterium]|nr:sugar ABC transporter permease [Clostridia bacterium]
MTINILAKSKKQKEKNKETILKNIKKHPALYAMIALPALLFLVFDYFPMYGLIIGFKEYDLLEGIMGSPWVGLKHFKSFFNDPYCYRLIKNTLLTGTYSLLWSFWPPIVLAILLNEVSNVKFRKTVQTITYLPHFISTVVIVGMMMELFGANGIINSIIKAFGHEPIYFFNESSWFRPLYIGSGIWSGVGYNSIIFMAALAGIDQEQFEAAFIDGANRFQRILYITLPGLAPTVTIMLIMRASSIVTVGFEKVYLMYSPATYETADVITTYVYRRGLGGGYNFGYSTAIGLINGVTSCIIICLTNYLAGKISENSLW